MVSDERLEGIQMMYSSLVAANGHVYYTSREGKSVVLKSGAPLQVVATNQLDDTVDSSLAIVCNSIFVRGLAQLYCIE